jgi:hypothetical protein
MQLLERSIEEESFEMSGIIMFSRVKVIKDGKAFCLKDDIKESSQINASEVSALSLTSACMGLVGEMRYSEIRISEFNALLPLECKGSMNLFWGRTPTCRAGYTERFSKCVIECACNF